jgi:hypothetical protein
MFTLMRDGGVAMWFILAFGGVALVAAGGYAAKKARSLDFIYGMAAATLFSTSSATCADLGATFAYVAKQAERSSGSTPETSQLVFNLLTGAGESMSPGILGFSLVSLTFFLVAVGQRRRLLDEEVA